MSNDSQRVVIMPAFHAPAFIRSSKVDAARFSIRPKAGDRWRGFSARAIGWQLGDCVSFTRIGNSNVEASASSPRPRSGVTMSRFGPSRGAAELARAKWSTGDRESRGAAFARSRPADVKTSFNGGNVDVA